MTTNGNCINIYSTVNSYTNTCRFCYSYTPQIVTSTITSCCKPIVCATNEYISSISALPNVVNNNTRTSERSLLLYNQQQYLQEVNAAAINQVVASTTANANSITSTIQGQLLGIRNQRYEPYQPYIYPVVPQSVIDLQMQTRNAGVPHSVFTIANCKGSQFVTT
jgi:hypothetical protein